MKLREALVPLAATAALAGCAHHQRPVSETTSGNSPITPTSKPEHLPPAFNPLDPLGRTLNAYREDILLHHKARIALGMCVGWPNSSGTTVTLNPGVAELQGREFYVFSSQDTRRRPSWIPLNGPDFLSADADVVIMTTGTVIDAKSPREVSPEEKESNGQDFFEDKRTKEPVLDTTLYPQALSMGGLVKICKELLNHEPIKPPPHKGSIA